MKAGRIALVIGAAIAVAVFLVTIPTFRHFFDLGVYRGAVRYWLFDGGDLYQYRYQGTEYGFTYPPFAALTMSPLALTSWPVAVAASLVLNSAAVILLLRWYFVPILRRYRVLDIWTPCALMFLGFLLFEPSRDTFSYGQVNLLLLVLVCSDLRNKRFAGVGIGLAAAIKLTPAVFIGYLILARRYREAATATITAAIATVLAMLVAPDASREFWTDAVWDTNRVGHFYQVSNQSLRGVLARLDAPGMWWLVAVVLVVAYWSWWVRTRRPDLTTGFAVTGVVACLISPISWVHHLVWLIPGVFLLLDRAVRAPTMERRRGLAVLFAGFAVMSSSIVWLWWAQPHGWAAFPGSNTYVWLSIAILLALTVTSEPALTGSRVPPIGLRSETAPGQKAV
ncbi:alpha-1,2-mannosyltransferase [Actinoplanes tereljensis]|uniref:Membrane protein n=1 Tax=Paractinoplanes tereljensis TaxID=571912 RepID=A0A919NJQ7_9ACTN|nr:glycosyltransferase 87 family protein [Actinoplanes tereljensis]GIF19142.1 membrane protein [Actinoplanes tereljensis]